MADDLDPVETREWLESLDAVLEFDGLNQAAFLLDELAGQTPALCEVAAAAALTAATPAAARAAAEGLHRTRRGAGPVYTHRQGPALAAPGQGCPARMRLITRTTSSGRHIDSIPRAGTGVGESPFRNLRRG